MANECVDDDKLSFNSKLLNKRKKLLTMEIVSCLIALPPRYRRNSQTVLSDLFSEEKTIFFLCLFDITNMNSNFFTCLVVTKNS